MTLLCLSIFFSDHATRFLKDAVALVEVWLAIYAAYVLIVAVHETGHWIVAQQCGFRVKEFRVSCLRWCVGWSFNWRGTNFLSGWVKVQLTEPDRMLRLRRLLFVAAGPAANLIFAALLYPIAVRQSTLGGMAKYLFVGNILFAAVNLVPVKIRKLKSDGLQILSTLFNPTAFETLRFHVRCQEAGPRLKRLQEEQNWLGLKELAEQLLLLSKGVRPKEREKAVRSLDTVLRFAEGRLAEAAIAAK